MHCCRQTVLAAMAMGAAAVTAAAAFDVCDFKPQQRMCCAASIQFCLLWE